MPYDNSKIINDFLSKQHNVSIAPTSKNIPAAKPSAKRTTTKSVTLTSKRTKQCHVASTTTQYRRAKPAASSSTTAARKRLNPNITTTKTVRRRGELRSHAHRMAIDPAIGMHKQTAKRKSTAARSTRQTAKQSSMQQFTKQSSIQQPTAVIKYSIHNTAQPMRLPTSYDKLPMVLPAQKTKQLMCAAPKPHNLPLVTTKAKHTQLIRKPKQSSNLPLVLPKARSNKLMPIAAHAQDLPAVVKPHKNTQLMRVNPQPQNLPMVMQPRKHTQVARVKPQAQNLPMLYRNVGNAAIKAKATAKQATQTPVITQQRCAVIALVGAPNAGKSTLINYLIGEKISIVSSKPQTTRTSLRGVLLDHNTQLVLIDTPGIFIPDKRRALERIIVRSAWSSIMEADLVCLIIDAQKGMNKSLEEVIEQLHQRHSQMIIALNKIDLASEEKKLTLANYLYKKGFFKEVFMISALKGRGVDKLRLYLLDNAPRKSWHFQGNEVTDAPLRFRLAEITREKLFAKLQNELPYSFSVRNELWEEMPDGSLKIHQVIYTMRDGQKKIILGKNGQLIKSVGEAARMEMMQVMGRKVHLFLFVKIKEDWQRDEENFSFNL